MSAKYSVVQTSIKIIVLIIFIFSFYELYIFISILIKVKNLVQPVLTSICGTLRLVNVQWDAFFRFLFFLLAAIAILKLKTRICTFAVKKLGAYFLKR